MSDTKTIKELFDSLTPEQQERVKREQAEYATASKAVKNRNNEDIKNNIVRRKVEDDFYTSDDEETFMKSVCEGDRFGDIEQGD